LQDGRLLPPLGPPRPRHRPSRVFSLADPVSGLRRRLPRSQATVAAPGPSLAAGPAPRRRDRWYRRGLAAAQGPIVERGGPIELRAQPCRDAVDLRPGDRVAL